MSKIIHPVTITAVVVGMIGAMPLVLKHSNEMLSDEQLRYRALSTGMKPVPKNYDELLRVVDTATNPISKEKIALGKELFFDTRLSRDNTISCASCHLLDDGGDDNKAVAIGYHGRANPFHLNSPTVLNAALEKFQFWDGRAKDVEEQAGGPIQAPFEMNMTPKEIEQVVNASSHYRGAFKSVFEADSITFEQIRFAIGAYERTLLTRGGYDKFLEGDDNAMSDSAKRGMSIFITRGCKGCHGGMSLGGQTMQKFPLRSYPFEYIGRSYKNPFPFDNKGGFLGQDNNLKFKVPVLRNITKTAPYFHNGAVDEIEEAVRIMSKYQIGDEFNKKQISDVVEFLKSLEGKMVKY